MMVWYWLAALAVMGLIGQPNWLGWLIIGFNAVVLFPPLWDRLALNDFETHDKARKRTALALTAFIALGTWSAINSQSLMAETDALLAKNDALLAEADATYPAEKHTFQWDYTSDIDPMTDKSVKLACITSSNAVRLSPPYEPTRAKLCLRSHPKHGRDAFVALEKDGQVMCRSYEGCTVQVRFDKSSARSFSAVGSNDGSTDIFFIRNTAKLEAGIQSAAVTAVQAEFYQAGNQVILFDTKGFDWK